MFDALLGCIFSMREMSRKLLSKLKLLFGEAQLTFHFFTQPTVSLDRDHSFIWSLSPVSFDHYKLSQFDHIWWQLHFSWLVPLGSPITSFTTGSLDFGWQVKLHRASHRAHPGPLNLQKPHWIERDLCWLFCHPSIYCSFQIPLWFWCLDCDCYDCDSEAASDIASSPRVWLHSDCSEAGHIKLCSPAQIRHADQLVGQVH